MGEATKRKIAALMKLTRGAGCSEAEAMAAASKAAALMAEHGYSEEDVMFGEAKAKAKTVGRGVRDRVWGSLARSTNTALIYSDSGLIFVGRGPGPEIAVYLFTVINRAFDKEITAYKATPNYRRRSTVSSKRRAVADFTAAMAVRVHACLRDLFRETTSENKQEAAIAVLHQRFPSRQAIVGQAKNFGRNKVAISAGLAAGRNVKLAHGVQGDGQSQLLLS